MSNPLVSCLCCTYGRPVLLGETVKCFVDQDYQNKELIILNDQKEVKLRIENCPDNIHIYNHPFRFNSLGEKRNYIKTLGHGDYYCIWDDDDLYVPFRISESVDLIQRNPQYDILKAKNAFISIDNITYKVATNRFHAQAIVTKEYMQKTAYPSKSVGEDNVFERTANVGYIDIFPSFWAILRWGMDIYHISCIQSEQTWQNVLEYEKYNKLKGEVVVKPEFQKDYWAEMKSVLEKINMCLGKEWYKKIGREI